ncbi:MAG: acyl-CoA thioesterase [Oscillospiraceae bacterium]|nr:acyl-CoA thioesterase [Oscillospiraceae bacterium]
MEITRIVEFFDLDPMSVVWHGNYVKYFESARCKFLDEIGFNYEQMAKEKLVFPVVKMFVKYIASCKFRQKIRIVATLVDDENFLRFKFRIFDAENGKTLTKADISHVAVDAETEETYFKLPDILLEKIAAYKKKING